MPDSQRLRSIQGFPKTFESPVRYGGNDLMMEDGDLVIADGDFAMVEGAAGVGQAIALSLSAYFADLSDPEGFAGRVRHQGAAKPRISSGSPEEFHEQTLWAMENDPELRTVDPRGMQVEERIDASINEVAAYLESVLDVRLNDHDVEIDYKPYGYETYVLRVDGLIPRPGVRFSFKAALPVRRASLLEVEDLTHRLVSHLKDTPELLRQISWRTFERLVAELLEAAGWQVLKLTRGSKDGGVDIYAAFPAASGSALAVIDCKRYREKIGVDKVRSIAGLKLQQQAELGILITTSYFTSGARDLERNELRDHVALHDFDRVSAWLAEHQWRKNSAGLYLPQIRFSEAADE